MNARRICLTISVLVFCLALTATAFGETASTPEELKVLIAAYKAGGRFAGCEVLQVKRGDLGENFTIPYACGSDVKPIELMVLDDQFRPANLKILLAQ